MQGKDDKKPYRSLKIRLIMQVSVFVAVSMLFMTGMVAYLVSGNLTDQMMRQLEDATHSSQAFLDQRIDYLVENTERLTKNPFVINGLVDADGRETYLPKLAQSFSEGRDVISFVLVDYDGKPLFQTVENVPDYNESVILRTALAKGQSSLFIQRPENHLVIVAPISYYDTTQGAVIVAFDLGTISKRYHHHYKDSYYRLILDQEVIEEEGLDKDNEYLSYVAASDEHSPYLKHLGVSVEIGIPKKTYLEPVLNDVIRLIFISLLFVIAAVLVSTWIGSGIATPILTLHKRVKRIKLTHLSKCSPLGTNDELEDLAVAFDERTDELLQTHEILEHDIQERINTQKELDHTRHYLQNIIDSMPSMLIGVDDKGFVTHWNQQAEDVSGINAEEARGKGLEQIMPMLSTQMKRVREAIQEQAPQQITRQLQNIKGDNRYTDITIYPLIANSASGAVIRIDDITERVRMEEMMMQTEKMMSVGGLAAGMAHEINNPLGGIMQGLQNIRRRLSPDMRPNQEIADSFSLDLNNVHAYLEKRQILHFMDEMTDAGKRASDIVSNMLQFSRKSEMTLEYEDINRLIDKTLDLAAVDYDLKKKYDFRLINIVRDFDESLPSVPCIASEIQQVLLNLLRNAAQALQSQSDNDTPSIKVKTHRDGNDVRILVQDNGPGMPANIVNRVFEPFFTTRPVGIGTGLGLSVSYFIVHDEHNGQIEVESIQGEGTTFTIILPLTHQELAGVVAS